MKKPKYQLNYSDLHKQLYNIEERQQKANKIISVLKDYYKDSFYNLNNFKLLDVGSSTGIITNLLSKNFKETIGIDIDEKAVNYSQATFENNNLHFYLQDSMEIKFDDNFFDVVVCAHIYEHVPDSQKLLNEIFRVLKPGGICYFTASNKLTLIEPHYRLPLLSIVPKKFAHLYLKIFRNINFYYENLLSYWELKKLVKNFEITDYTKQIIKYPAKYYATEMIKPNSILQNIYLFILKTMFWVSPTFVWILRKNLKK